MNDSPGWASPGSDTPGQRSAQTPDQAGLPAQAGPPSEEAARPDPAHTAEPADAAPHGADAGRSPTAPPAAEEPEATEKPGAPGPPVTLGKPEGAEAAGAPDTAGTAVSDAGAPGAGTPTGDAGPVAPGRTSPQDGGQPPPGPPVPPNWSAAQPPPGHWSHAAPPGVGHPVPPPPPGPNAGGYPGPGGYPGAGGYPGPPPGWGMPGGPAPYWGAPPAPKPGVVPLRPLDVGALFSGAIAVLRVHWRKVLGFTLVASLIFQPLTILLSRHNLQGSVKLLNETQPTLHDLEQYYRHAVPAYAGTLGISLVAQIVTTSVLILIVSRSVLGRPVDLSEVWREARPRMLPMLGLLVALILVAAGIAVVCLGPGLLVLLAGSSAGGAVLLCLGVPAMIVVMAWLLVSFSLATPALMLEKQGIRDSLARSFKLVRGSWWRVLGVLLLSGLFTGIVSALVQAPFLAVADSMSGAGATGSSGILTMAYTGSASATLLLCVGSIIGSTIALPVSAGITSLLYIDRRIRTEGLDLELARAAGIPGYTAP